jgi:signal transduction histidine kinase
VGANDAGRSLDGELRARLSANPVAIDVLIALGLTALSLITIAGGARDLGSYDPLSLVLLVSQTLPLAFRRRFPFAVLVVAVGATIAHAALAREAINSTLGFLVAIYTVGEHFDRRRSGLMALVCALAVGALILARAPMPAALSGLVQTELAVLAAWVLGTWARDRRLQLGTAEERASRLEREREERDRQAVAEERERIARELHDVVTHHVSVIVIQAGAALRALDRRPADARQAVEAIDGTARQALGDMRRMLGILGRAAPAGGTLGGEGDAEAGSDADLSPMPGLESLGALLDQVRAVGARVELSITGERRPLDPAIELSAYRIVQEALTNALRHAPGARIRVAVGYSPSTLEVRIDDDGPVDARPGEHHVPVGGGSGHGLIGMRERVAVFGGTFEAGPVGRGFRVVARLPLAAGAAVSPRPASTAVGSAES